MSDDRSSGEPPLDGAFRQDQELVTAPLENASGDTSQTAGTVQPFEPFQPRDNVQRVDSDKTIAPDDENIPPFPPVTVTTEQVAMNCGRPIKKTRSVHSLNSFHLAFCELESLCFIPTHNYQVCVSCFNIVSCIRQG